MDPHQNCPFIFRKENNFPRFVGVEGKGLDLEWSVEFVKVTCYTYGMKHHCSNEMSQNYVSLVEWVKVKVMGFGF